MAPPGTTGSRVGFAVVATCAIVLVWLFSTAGWRRPVSSDGYYYFVWLRSIWYDLDVNLTDDYLSSGNPYSSGTTPTGYADNVFPIGCAVLWMPFFAVAKAVEVVAGGNPSSESMSLLEGRSVAVGTLAYGIMGLILLYRSSRRVARAGSSIASVAAILWGTFLAYYLTVKPSMSEGCSFFTQALVLYLVGSAYRGTGPVPFALAGVAIGISTAVRYHNAASIALLIPLLPPLWKRGARAMFVAGAQLGGGILIGFSPQAYVLQRLYGSPFSLGSANRLFDPLGAKVMSVLFSSDHGLFWFHPVTLLAFIGLLLLQVQGRGEPRGLLVAFLLHVYASSIGATIGASFGARRFAGALPVLATGLSWFLQVFVARGTTLRRLVGVFLVLSAVLWNLFLWSSFRSAFGATESVNLASLFDDNERGRNAQRVKSIYLGRDADHPAVRDGWGNVASEGAHTFRRIADESASVRLLLPEDGGLVLTLFVRTLGECQIPLRLSIGEAWSADLTTTPSWEEKTVEIFVSGRSGPARLVLRPMREKGVEHIPGRCDGVAVAWIRLVRIDGRPKVGNSRAQGPP